MVTGMHELIDKKKRFRAVSGKKVCQTFQSTRYKND